MSLNTLALESVANTGATTKPPSTDSTLAGLTKYIPTESLTLYIAAVSSAGAINEFIAWFTPLFNYIFFIVVTPLLMLLIHMRQLKNNGKDWRIPVTDWPWWKLIASTIAFAVWALAVPNNPVVPSDSTAGGVAVGFLALFISTFLNFIAPFFETQEKLRVKPIG